MQIFSKMTSMFLQEWEKAWDMEFNPCKCQVLHISRSLSLSFSILPAARFRALSAGVHCTLQSGLQDESLQVIISK